MSAKLRSERHANATPSTDGAVDLLESLSFRPFGLVKDFSRSAAARRAVLDKPERSEILHPRGRRRNARRAERRPRRAQ